MTSLVISRRSLASIFSSAIFALALASCSSSDGPNDTPGLQNSIVFVSDRTGAQEIYVMNADGSNPRQLTSTAPEKAWPTFSPDGRKIVYAEGLIAEEGASTLFVMNADGTDAHAITSVAAMNTKPAWSADGSQIAFTTGRDGNEEIYVMSADGSGQVNHTNSFAADWDPAWQPHGSRLLFTTDRDDPNEIEFIYALDLQSDSVTRLVRGAQPEWSPSGTMFVFKDGQGTEISLNPDGSSVRFLASDDHRHFTPTWSPDEATFAFSRVGADEGEEIWTMSAASGADLQQLTTSEQGNNSYPNWTRH
jgi:Tol biopolymer transport system component